MSVRALSPGMTRDTLPRGRTAKRDTRAGLRFEREVGSRKVRQLGSQLS